MLGCHQAQLQIFVIFFTMAYELKKVLFHVKNPVSGVLWPPDVIAAPHGVTFSPHLKENVFLLIGERGITEEKMRS